MWTGCFVFIDGLAIIFDTLKLQDHNRLTDHRSWLTIAALADRI
jgi:hypothetical protein